VRKACWLWRNFKDSRRSELLEEGEGLRTISTEAARGFLVSRQKYGCWKGKTGVLEAVRRLECIQTDPISVVHRNQHLVLHSRVVDYEVSYLDDLLYEDRAVFEYWCNEKSIVPIEDFPYFNHRMQNHMEFHSPFYERIKAERKKLKSQISQVLSMIKKEGPLSAQDFERCKTVEGKVATRVLNLLWDCGELMIHHVEGNRRYFDLTERVLPFKTRMPPVNREEYESFMVEKYMRAYGLVDTRDWRFGWRSMKASERKVTVERMLKEGKIFPMKIDSVKHVYYVLEEYLNALEEEEKPSDEKVYLIAPLDNLLWNRRMISEIFGFDYAWEVYKVPEKRKYGYYVMPILRGTKFIGRLDPKLDRQDRKMILNALLLEEKRIDKPLVDELAQAIDRFCRFHDAHEVEIRRTEPKELRDSLMPVIA